MHNQTQPLSPTTTAAISESEGLARDIKAGTLSGFVGHGTLLTGDITFKGMLRVDGKLSGNVSSEDGTLVVSTNGLIEADVEVAVAQVLGTVKGDIIASNRIEVGRVAKVTGNIYTPALVIEEGAVFEGSCRMIDRPTSKQAVKKKIKELGATGKSAGAHTI
jgi:cytoskeletal protein CcmA (bactofilin family)